MMNNLKFAL